METTTAPLATVLADHVASLDEHTTEAIVIPADQYVARSVYGPDVTSTIEWADRFKALGGEACNVRMAWQAGMAVGAVVVVISGTRRAVNMVLDGLAS